jgi:hypothetical protein
MSKYLLTYERTDIETVSQSYRVTVEVEANSPEEAADKFEADPEDYNTDPDDLQEIENSYDLLSTDEIGKPEGTLRVYRKLGEEPVVTIELTAREVPA